MSAAGVRSNVHTLLPPGQTGDSARCSAPAGARRMIRRVRPERPDQLVPGSRMTSGKPLDSAQNPIFERHRIRPGPAFDGPHGHPAWRIEKTCSFLPRSQIRSHKRFHGAGGLQRGVNGHDGDRISPEQQNQIREAFHVSIRRRNLESQTRLYATWPGGGSSGSWRNCPRSFSRSRGISRAPPPSGISSWRTVCDAWRRSGTTSPRPP